MDTSETAIPRSRYATAISVIALLIATAAMGIVIYRIVQEQRRILPFAPVEQRAPDHFLVKFKPGTPAETVRSINARAGSKEIDSIPALGVKLMTVAPGKTLDEMIALYKKNPNVSFAESDFVMSATLTPNDPYYINNQTLDTKITAPSAWDISTGSSAVKIAILDTGIDLTHPEFAGRLTSGYDFVFGDADPTDDNGHGTACAGIAAATGNNSIGIPGMDWKATIMPVKVLDSSGIGFTSDIAKGMTYAADNGAKVLSMSFGGALSSTLQSGADYASGKGCVLVAASGNDGLLLDRYPASGRGVISVGALQGDTIASFSNYGPNLDVVAPGVSIYTTLKGGGYTWFSGTSAATPYVAGLASLLFSTGSNQTSATVSQEITSTATDLGSAGWDQYYGWGRIDSLAALRAAGGASGGTTPPSTTTTVTPTPSPTPTTTPSVVDTTAPSVAITSPAAGSTLSGNVTLLASASDAVGVTRVDFFIDGTLLGSVASAPYSVTWNTTKVANSTHVVSARAYDAAGNAGNTAITVTTSNVSRKKK